MTVEIERWLRKGRRRHEGLSWRQGWELIGRELYARGTLKFLDDIAAALTPKRKVKS